MRMAIVVPWPSLFRVPLRLSLLHSHRSGVDEFPCVSAFIGNRFSAVSWASLRASSDYLSFVVRPYDGILMGYDSRQHEASVS